MSDPLLILYFFWICDLIAYKIGRYLGWYYNQEHKGRIVLGKDTRHSSYMYEYTLVAGVTASGSDVYMLQVTTTPSVAYVVRTENFDCVWGGGECTKN